MGPSALFQREFWCVWDEVSSLHTRYDTWCAPRSKKHTRRYREVIDPAKVLEGQKNLTKKRRYANRHG
jgi:hypothetical protein